MNRFRKPTFVARQVNSFSAHKFHIGPRGVKVRVVRDHVALLAHHVEQDPLCCAALMRGDHMLIAENALYGIAETGKTRAAGVAFIAAHDARPLFCGHGAGSGIGKQINQYVFSSQLKEVIVRCPKKTLPLLARGPAQGLNTFDPEGFDDGRDRHKSYSYCPAKRPSVSWFMIKSLSCLFHNAENSSLLKAWMAWANPRRWKIWPQTFANEALT